MERIPRRAGLCLAGLSCSSFPVRGPGDLDLPSRSPSWGDGAGPDDHAGGVIFSPIQWLVENSLREDILKGLIIVHCQYMVIFIIPPPFPVRFIG